MAVRVDGTVAAGFEPVRAAFEENFRRHGELGAACCVYHDGRLVVDLAGGVTRPAAGPDGAVPYTGDTLQLVASATKGAMAICALRLAERGVLDLDAPVAEYWPEFAAEDKAAIPVRWLLSHQAGLPAVDHVLPMADVYRWQPMVDALAAQRPMWEPGSAHGYHAVTYGWLVGEVLRRASGSTPGQLLATEIAGPLGVDFWVGLPEPQLPRLAPLVPAPPPPVDAGPDAFAELLTDPTSLAHKAFFVPNGLLAAVNDPALLAAQIPAANGVATARALAAMYAACVGELNGTRLLAPESVRAALTPRAEGPDRVLGFPTRFGPGFQLPFPLRPMAGDGSFGHYGLGGSVGFAAVDHGLSFGYVVNRMRSGGEVDPRSASLVAAALACVR